MRARFAVIDIYAETAGACTQVVGPCESTVCRYALVERTIAGRLRERHRFPTSETNCSIREARANPDGMTLEAVAQKIGLTRERVRQIEAHGLEKLGVFGRQIGFSRRS